MHCSQQPGGVADSLANLGDANAGSNPVHGELFSKIRCFETFSLDKCE